jgi:hypothetical protein
MDPGLDYYKILGVDRRAGIDDINRAYRVRALQFHPDTGGSESEMKLLNEARDVLTDPEARKSYDLQRPQHESEFAFVSSSVKPPAEGTVRRHSGVPRRAMGAIAASLICFFVGMYIASARILPLVLFGAGVILAHYAFYATQAFQRLDGPLVRSLSGKYDGILLALLFDFVVLLIMLAYRS